MQHAFCILNTCGETYHWLLRKILSDGSGDSTQKSIFPYLATTTIGRIGKGCNINHKDSERLDI